jgi:membrane protease YdiL (CAAX protease family)
MSSSLTSSSRTISPRLLAHQEGLICVVALIGLLLREGELLPYLAPRSGWPAALAAGAGVGCGLAAMIWLLRSIAPARELEEWLSDMLRKWSVSDALSVAFISGVAEEALIRALLQPMIGLVPAALLFALLHIFPDRRLWFWPLLALTLGLVIGLLFEHFGYPAAALAHITVNAIGMVRVCGRERAAGVDRSPSENQ